LGNQHSRIAVVCVYAVLVLVLGAFSPMGIASAQPETVFIDDIDR